MAYRNGTYVAFHAEGTSDPTDSDVKYYRIMMAWHEHDDIVFKFINSHDKVASVRDSSAKETLRRSLKERLNNSRNMVLIIGPTTRFDTDWVPFEIEYAVDKCGIPIIATYTQYSRITEPNLLCEFWPEAFAERIASKKVRAIHIPFKRKAIDSAIRQFDHNNPPATALDYYSLEAHHLFEIS